MDISTVQPNPALEKRLNRLAYGISALVLLLVGAMRRIKFDLGADFSFLPPLHASLNALAALFLIVALYFIRRGMIGRHRQAIYGALVCSALFLISYVLYHFTTPEVLFGDLDHDGRLSDAERLQAGGRRTFYLIVLLTHIVLAAVILPFILLTFNRAFTGQYARHRRMARWVFPLWLYVAITGPLCYWLLRPYYP
jgi:putative membrane protein